jgi:hypothetical protein
MLIGTLFSVILAGLLWWDPHLYEAPLGTTTRFMMIASVFSFLFLLPLGLMFSWLPLQKGEQNSTPHILEMFHRDKHVLMASGWLVAFSLATFVFASDILYPSISQKPWFFPVWIILLGVSVDVLVNFVRRVFCYLNPFCVVKLFAKEARQCISNNKELDLCTWIDALAEVSIKGLQKQSTAVCHEALAEQQNLIRLFLSASKSIAHPEQDAQTKILGIQDKVSYTLFYVYQRLDIIFEKALKNHLEPTCSQIITLLGKIAIDAAKYDMSLASAPLRFIGKFAKRAQDQGFEETVMTASCVFSEVAKTIVTEIDLTYYEIKDAFLSIINGMEVLSKDAFKRDKTTNISLLMQPFKELRVLFDSEKMKNHQDTPVIVQNIDRVLGEYEALLIVMHTIPPIPKIEDTISG